MPPNAKPVILWDNVLGLGTLTANDTQSKVANIKDWRDFMYWEAASPGTKYLTVDLNLVTNPGFETGDFTAWTQNSATIENGYPYPDNTYASRLAATGSDKNGAFSSYCAVDSSRMYKCSVRGAVTAYSAGLYEIRLVFRDKEYSWIGSETLFYESADLAWTLRQKSVGPSGSGADWIFPAGTAYIQFQQKWQGGTPTGNGHMDDALFYEVKTPDTLAILGHNLWSADATVSVQSCDNVVEELTTWTERLAGFTPGSDRAVFKTFTGVSARAWRIKLVTVFIAPWLAVAVIGQRTTMERYPSSPFDPTAEEIKAESNQSIEGHLLGSVIEHHRREIDVDFKNITPSWVDNTFAPAWAHMRQLKPFFFAWDITNHPDEVCLVKVPDNFARRMPYNGARRSLSLSLIGISEE